MIRHRQSPLVRLAIRYSFFRYVYGRGRHLREIWGEIEE